jgi:hypothetical protein
LEKRMENLWMFEQTEISWTLLQQISLVSRMRNKSFSSESLNSPTLPLQATTKFKKYHRRLKARPSEEKSMIWLKRAKSIY